MKTSLLALLAAGMLAGPAHLSYADDKPKKPAKAKVKPKDEGEGDSADGVKAEGDMAPAEGKAKGKGKKGYHVAYGMAGCGIGSLAFPENSKGPQIGAWFINGLTFQCSIISSTNGSNCESGPDKQTAAVEQEVFVTVNLAELEKDAAQGHGEHMDAFAEILGCDTAVDRARLGALSQGQYSLIFASSEPKTVLRNYLHAVQLDNELAKNCSRAGLAPDGQMAQLSQR